MILIHTKFGHHSICKRGKMFLHMTDDINQHCSSRILCFVDLVSLYNHFQMKPTRCTLLLSIFISTSLHVSVNYVPIIRRTYCTYATPVYFILYGWLSGLQTRRLPIQNGKYWCCTDTVSSPDDGHIVD